MPQTAPSEETRHSQSGDSHDVQAVALVVNRHVLIRCSPTPETETFDLLLATKIWVVGASLL
jgi:hypothetical protein